MRTEQSSTLYLLSGIDLDSGYENTLSFATPTTQNNYFASKILASFDKNIDYNYLRAEGTIRVEALLDDIFSANYVMYKNEDKWYYAFITKKEYINNNATRLYIKIDILQTYMFDFSLKECFVEREHQDRWEYDIVLSKLKPLFNIQKENLEIGDKYKTTSLRFINGETLITNPVEVATNTNFSKNKFMYMYIWATSPMAVDQTPLENFREGNSTNSFVDVGLYIYCIPFSNYETNNVKVKATSDGTAYLMGTPALITRYIRDNPAVFQMEISPIPPTNFDFELYGSASAGEYTLKFYDYGLTYTIEELKPDDSHTYLAMVIKKRNLQISTLSDNCIKTGYIKSLAYYYKDNISYSTLKDISYETKLLTKPYYFQTLYFGNENIDIQNEYLTDNTALHLFKSLSLEATSALYVVNYNDNNSGIINNFALITNSLPNMINLTSDAWKDYLLNNKNSRMSGFITSGVGTVAGLALAPFTGGLSLALVAGGAISTGSQIANQLAQEQDIKNKPDAVKNSMGDMSFDYFKNNLLGHKIEYEIETHYKNKLFNYFYHYGYLAKEFKTPDINSRYYFNYIKTINCNITANIDNEIKEEIMDIFNKGLTIWHYRDASTFKGINNYDYENVEMSLIGD